MNSFKYLFLIGLLFASAYCQRQSLLSFSAAKIKLDNAISILNTPNEPDSLYIGAVVAGVDAIFGGSMVVLPSRLSTIPIQDKMQQGAYEEIKNPMSDFEKGPKGFNATITSIDMLLEAMTSFLGIGNVEVPLMQGETMQKTPGGMPSARDVILTGMDMLLLTKEILLNLARYSVRCDPNLDLNTQGEYCKLFTETDEIGAILDDVLTDMTSPLNQFFREVRSPLFAIQSGPIMQSAKSYQTGNIGSGECTAIVQHTPGLKAVFRVATITYWNFPWLGASSLVGKKAFVFEWVPAQVIKTLSLCNHVNPSTERNELLQEINIETVMHRELLHLWNLVPVTSQ